jgi:hypothetical protein
LEPACEGHPQIVGVTEGVRVVVHRPEVLAEPVLEGAGEADGRGVAIYGSVIREGGTFRMWYQATPRQELTAGDTVLVGCVESDDGLSWRRPEHGVMEWAGNRRNHLTDLPFHCPSVLIDPTAPPEARYRAFGCTGRRKLPDLPKGFGIPVRAWYEYHTAHSADGIHWTVDGPDPVWPGMDVITSTWDPWTGNALVAFKRVGRSANLRRRRFFNATWATGVPGNAVSALIPDEYDDLVARARGFESADYYGVGLYPGPTVTIGFLWNFRHHAPRGDTRYGRQGRIGCVDISLVYQTERGGRWQHLPGRPDWLTAADMPDWATGCVYTAASPIEVGDETWLYFAGTRNHHGWAGIDVDTAEFCRAQDPSRIGLARWPRGRLMGFESRLHGLVRLTPRSSDNGTAVKMVVNATTRPGGRVRAALVDEKGEPLTGYRVEDCEPLTGDHPATEIRWRGGPDGPKQPSGSAVVELEGATLYGFAFETGGE